MQVNIKEFLSISLVCCSVCIGNSYAGSMPIVDFDKLGEPLNPRSLNSRERDILRKLSIRVDLSSYSNERTSLGYDPIPRVFKLYNSNEKVVVTMFCDTAANGSYEGCSVAFGSLSIGYYFIQPFRYPDDLSGTKEDFSYNTANAQVLSRFLTNNKNELVSILTLKNKEKSFKGKKKCNNKITLWGFDLHKMAIVEQKSKTIGNQCYSYISDDELEQRVKRAYLEISK